MSAPGPHLSTGGRRARRRTQEEAQRAAVAYDFRRPIQLSREHSRVLQVAFDGFARQATTAFTSTLRTICQVSLTSVEQRSYAEYVDSLASMTYLVKFSVEPLPGIAVLELPLPAVMASVDHMLGGPGTDEQPHRALTDIESVVITGLVERLLSGLQYALSELVELEPDPAGIEYNPQFAQAAGPSDVVVVVHLEARISETPHRITVCLPFNALLPHLTAAAAPAPVSPRERAERAEAAQLLDRRFHEVPVDVSVRLRGTRLASDVFTGLQVGDVLRLDHPAAAPLDVCVDEALFAHATAGATAHRLAARIVATPTSPTTPQEHR